MLLMSSFRDPVENGLRNAHGDKFLVKHSDRMGCLWSPTSPVYPHRTNETYKLTANPRGLLFSPHSGSPLTLPNTEPHSIDPTGTLVSLSCHQFALDNTNLPSATNMVHLLIYTFSLLWTWSLAWKQVPENLSCLLAWGREDLQPIGR